jgi:hypothetical protein
LSLSAMTFNDHLKRNSTSVHDRTRRGVRGFIGVGPLVVAGES